MECAPRARARRCRDGGGRRDPTDVVVEIEGSGAASAENLKLLIQLLGSTVSWDLSRDHGPSGSPSDLFHERPWTIHGLLGGEA